MKENNLNYEFSLITTIRLTRVTVRLYSSFNFPFMFDYSKTNTEKISSLRTDQCLSQDRGGRGGGVEGFWGSEDFGCHDEIYLIPP